MRTAGARGSGNGRRRSVAPWAAASVFAAAAVMAVLQLHVLAEQQAGGPAHEDLTVGDGIPATFYIPGRADRATGVFPDPPQQSARFPAIVLAHGFSADRMVMSSLARSLAAAGYAVMTFDFRGHGTNPNGFRSGELVTDLGQVLGWVARSPYVDAGRITLMGHSMGGTVALDVATSDTRPAAVVVLSSAQRLADGVDVGSMFVDGPRRPPNVLFLWSADDPSFIRTEDLRLASRLAGQPIQPDRTYGDVAKGTGMRAHVLTRLNHGTELWSSQTVAQTVGWLDQSFGMSRPEPARRIDPRLGTAGLYGLCVIVLIVGVGFVAAKLSSPTVSARETPGWAAIAVVAISLLIAVAFALPVSAPGFLSITAYGPVVALIGLAGGALAALVALARTSIAATQHPWLPRLPKGDDIRAAVLPAAAVTVAVYALLAPLGVVGHNLAPTPERLLAVAVVFIVLAPFFVLFQSLLRQGRPISAAARSISGHVVLIMAIDLAVSLGQLPGVVSLLVLVLALVFMVVELVASSFYRWHGSATAIGLAEAALLAWMIAVMAPVG